MAKRKSFLRRAKEVLVDFFGNIRFYKGGFIIFGDTTLELKGPDWREILDLVKPGDMILNAHNHYVSSIFIKGDFGHVGLYVGDNQMIHVMTEGIIKNDILTFLRADGAAVVRIKDQTKVALAIHRAYEQLTKDVEYDYDFDKQDTSQFYCSEFTDFCYDYPLREGVSKGKGFILPDDYLIPSDLFDVIWIKK
jgi:uncharacterized protein YycO